jgi:phosphopantothenate-cysteine ligase
MNVIVTAGGTSESIDSVRTITNMSTGVLGSLIAEAIIDTLKDVKVYFIGSEPAIKFLKSRGKVFDIKRIEFIPVTDTASVEQELVYLLENKEIKSVVHAMAVSDYTVDKVYSINSIIENIKNNEFSKDEIIEMLSNPIKIDNSSKISSNLNSMDIRLKKTPKLINMIKEISPSTQLIGFKLLNGVSNDELLKVARESIVKTGADYIIANDLTDVTPENHIAYIVELESAEKIEGKFGIAKEIANLVKEVNFE